MSKIIARPTVASFIILSGIWFIYGLMFLFLFLRDNNCCSPLLPILLIAISIITALLLSRFSLSLDSEKLTYKNLFKKHHIAVNEITFVAQTWMTFSNLPSVFKIPRLVIQFGHANEVVINEKLFLPAKIDAILKHLEKMCAESVVIIRREKH